MSKLAIRGGKPLSKKPITPAPFLHPTTKKLLARVFNESIFSTFDGSGLVKEFESEFAKFNQTKRAIATNSGTSALHAALAACNLKKNDEVLIPAYTFVAGASTIIQERAKPVFVDIEEDTYCISPQDMENKITKKTRAIMPVHIYGHPADMKKITKIAARENITIIEDCAQAHGAKIGNKMVGTFGLAGCYSFSRTKNLTTGEGGMLVTNSQQLADEVKIIRQNGKESWKVHKRLGYNYRMTEMQAALGLDQLHHLAQNNRIRQRNALIYFKKLKNLGFQLPVIKKNISHVFYKFPILIPPEFTKKRDKFVKAVLAENVPIETGYYEPLNKIPFLAKVSSTRSCAVAEDICERIINLYTSPSLSSKNIADTCFAIQKVYDQIQKL